MKPIDCHLCGEPGRINGNYAIVIKQEEDPWFYLEVPICPSCCDRFKLAGYECKSLNVEVLCVRLGA